MNLSETSRRAFLGLGVSLTASLALGGQTAIKAIQTLQQRYKPENAPRKQDDLLRITLCGQKGDVSFLLERVPLGKHMFKSLAHVSIPHCYYHEVRVVEPGGRLMVYPIDLFISSKAIVYCPLSATCFDMMLCYENYNYCGTPNVVGYQLLHRKRQDGHEPDHLQPIAPGRWVLPKPQV